MIHTPVQPEAPSYHTAAPWQPSFLSTAREVWEDFRQRGWVAGESTLKPSFSVAPGTWARNGGATVKPVLTVLFRFDRIVRNSTAFTLTRQGAIMHP
jgi:hypothetical protein